MVESATMVRYKKRPLPLEEVVTPNVFTHERVIQQRKMSTQRPSSIDDTEVAEPSFVPPDKPSHTPKSRRQKKDGRQRRTKQMTMMGGNRCTTTPITITYALAQYGIKIPCTMGLPCCLSRSPWPSFSPLDARSMLMSMAPGTTPRRVWTWRKKKRYAGNRYHHGL